MKGKLKGLGVSLAIFIVIFIVNTLFSAQPIVLTGIDKYSNNISIEDARELGFILFERGQYPEARAFLKTSAEKGDITSQLMLGTLNFYDLTEINNYQQAFYLFSQNSDNALAQYYLGLLYHFGYYVPKSPLKYLYWLEKSAAQSFPIAQHNFAVYYFNLGDYKKAYLWALYARGNNFSQSRTLVKQAAEHLSLHEKAYADQTYNSTKTKHRWDNEKNNQINTLLEKVL